MFRKRLTKYEGVSVVSRYVRNATNFFWVCSKPKDNTELKISYEIRGDLQSRYFVCRNKDSTGEKIAPFSWCSDMNSRRSTKKVRPGRAVKIKLGIEPREYCPAGRHNIEIAIIGEDSAGKKETIATATIKLTVTAKHKYDDRMATLRDIGAVDYKYSNKLYDDLKPSTKNIAVIMAIWKRIERLDISLNSFAAQEKVNPVIYLWVNNREVESKVKRLIDKARVPVVAYFSKNNIGGYGRFYLARDISSTYEKAIFIDDDQVPRKDAFRTMVDEYKPDEILGVYASQIPLTNDYWYRKEIKPGDEADYIGTCGMICPLSIFNDKELFECPREYWFIEDLWLCWFAHIKYGWGLKKSAAVIDVINDSKDQFRPMIDLKNEFFRYLVRKARGKYPVSMRRSK